MPAYAYPVASIVSAETVPPGRPKLTSFQLSPSVVESKTEPPAPAKRCPSGLTATALMSGNAIPTLRSSQLSPLSIERNTPPPSPNWDIVPAKMCPFGATASAAMSVDVSPLFTSCQ